MNFRLHIDEALKLWETSTDATGSNDLETVAGYVLDRADQRWPYLHEARLITTYRGVYFATPISWSLGESTAEVGFDMTSIHDNETFVEFYPVKRVTRTSWEKM